MVKTMTDRNIDLELIIAIAEESLPPEEAAAAEAALDDASRAELVAQRQALSALAQIRPATMSAGESSSLRSALRTELNLDAATTAAALSPSTTRWYVRMLPALGAAAALVFVVGIGLSSLGGVSDESATAEKATSFDVAEAQADTEATEAASALLLDGSASADEDAGPEARDPNLSTTRASTAADSPAATEEMAEGAALVFRLVIPPDDLGEVSVFDEEALAAVVNEAAGRIADFTPYPADSLDFTASEPGLVCWTFIESNVGPETQIDYLGTATVDGEPGEVYRTLEKNGEGVIYVILVNDCEPIGLIPR